MSMHPAISTETYREKALRKFKQQPLVPVGTERHLFHLASVPIDYCEQPTTQELLLRPSRS